MLAARSTDDGFVDAHTQDGSLLRLERFGVAFDRGEVLHSIDLRLPNRGAHAVMGPGGAGKSTLLRTLAGLNEAQPTFRVWGSACYQGSPLGRGTRPSIVGQSARLLMADAFENVAIGLPSRSALTRREQRSVIEGALAELGVTALAQKLDARVVDLSLADQRTLALVRAFVSDAALLLLDEPTAGLDDGGRQRVLDAIVRVAERRAVLWVSHDQAAVRRVGGAISLLVGGTLRATADVPTFFRSPPCPEAKHFVETGTCYLPPTAFGAAEPRRDQRTTRPPNIHSLLVGAKIPRGLVWVYPKRLAGVPRPGLLEDVESDVAGLSSLGVDVLVCLEEQQTVPADLLRRHGIESIWVPIEDMNVPSTETALGLCLRLGSAIDAGRVVAVHCRAGLGRTGTMLAAFLIWEGAQPLDALERVRLLQSRFVQSEAQVAFLDSFALAVADARPSRRNSLVVSRAREAVPSSASCVGATDDRMRNQGEDDT